MTKDTPVPRHLAKPSQAQLNEMMLQLVGTLWRLSDEVSEMDFAERNWDFSFFPERGHQGVHLSIGMPGGQYYSLSVTRDGETELYEFRNKKELDRLIPVDKEAFIARWRLPELAFAESLPVSMAVNNGQRRSTRTIIAKRFPSLRRR